MALLALGTPVAADDPSPLVPLAIEHQTFHRFDALELHVEGATLTSGPGSLVVIPLGDRPYRLRIHAERLRFSFEPADDLREPALAVLEALRRLQPESMPADARNVELTCSPRWCERLLAGAFRGLRSVGREQLDPWMRSSHERFEALVRTDRERRFETRQLPLDDRRELLVLSTRRADGRGVDLRFDSHAPRELTIGPRGKIWLAAAGTANRRDARMPNDDVDRQPDAAAPPFTVTAMEGTVDFTSNEIGTLRASLDVVLALRRPTDRILLRLESSGRAGPVSRADAPLQIERVEQVGNGHGESLGWVQTGPSEGFVMLGRRAGSGATLRLKLELSHRDAIRQTSASFVGVPRERWLPFVDARETIERYALSVRTPPLWHVVSTGELVETIERDGATERRFRARAPVTFPTLALGHFITVAAETDGVPVKLLVDSTGREDWGLRDERFPPLASAAADAITVYERLLGSPFPYSGLQLVHDPLRSFHGQSPAGVVYLGSFLLRDEAPVDTSWGALAHGSTDAILAHEVAHQWWGCRIHAANTRAYWLIEAAAEYASALYAEEVARRQGAVPARRAYRQRVKRWRRFAVESRCMASIEDAAELSYGDFQTAAYARGPLVFHMLRTRFGDDAFFRFLRRLPRALYDRPVTTRDLQREAEAAFGTSLEVFFDAWVRHPGLPELDVLYRVESAKKGYAIRGRIEQQVTVEGLGALPGVAFELELPVTVEGRGSRVWQGFAKVRGDDGEFELRVPWRPRVVRFDPERDLPWRELVVAYDE